ncbi:hypothetical protein CASFOL_010828 [Castilleja foliolosa]|uniref:Selenoprotein H n=1 Tax=Castilleja foliolosa TaxID=1961234 RepID=A0ABD3DU75_9LAMI
MAPKRKTTATTRNAARAETRATRSAIRRREAILTPFVDNPQPRKKRKVETPDPAPVAPAPAPAAVAPSPAAVAPSPAAGAPSPAAVASSPAAVASSPAAGASSPAAGASSPAAVKTVIIEHCLENDSFKKKAEQIRKGLEKGLEKAVSEVKVVVNPEVPRKGCFEIREEGGDAFVSLLDIETPFNEVKAVNVKKVVAEIVGKLK